MLFHVLLLRSWARCNTHQKDFSPDDNTFSKSAHRADILFSGKSTHGKPYSRNSGWARLCDSYTSHANSFLPSLWSPPSAKSARWGEGNTFPFPSQQHLQPPGPSQLAGGLLNNEVSAPKLPLSDFLNNRILLEIKAFPEPSQSPGALE